MNMQGKIRETRLEATITRADGTVEPLGTIAYTHRNPLKMLLWHIGRWVQQKKQK